MRLALQRKLEADRGKWRTVCRFGQTDAPTVQKAAEALSQVDRVLFRIVTDDELQNQLAHYDGTAWH